MDASDLELIEHILDCLARQELVLGSFALGFERGWLEILLVLVTKLRWLLAVAAISLQVFNTPEETCVKHLHSCRLLLNQEIVFVFLQELLPVRLRRLH